MRKTLIILAAFSLFFVSCGGKKVTKKVEDPGVIYVEGVDQMKKKQYDKAVASFAKVRENYPFDPIAVVAQVKQADAYFTKKDYPMAASTYEDFVNSYPDDENAPYAMKRLAESYEKQLPTVDRDQAITYKALERYTYMKNRYPASPYAKDAENHIKTLNERLAAREFYVGEFYYRTGNYNASIMRLEYMLSRFPETRDREKAFHYLIEDYKELDQADKAQQYSDLLAQQYPKSIYLKGSSGKRKASSPPAKQAAPTAKAVATPATTVVAVTPATTGPTLDYTDKKKREIPLRPLDDEKRGDSTAGNAREPQAASGPSSAAVVKAAVSVPEVHDAVTPKEPSTGAPGGSSKSIDDAPKKVTQGGEKEDRLGFFSGKGPIEIDGDAGESFEKGKVLTFKGNVIAKQLNPDPTQTFYLFCDRLTARTTEDTKEIESLEAEGNVKLVKQDKTATSKQAFYYKETDKDKARVILKGDVVVFLGTDKLSADTVTYFVDEDRFYVQGDKEKRAKATITPKK